MLCAAVPDATAGAKASQDASAAAVQWLDQSNNEEEAFRLVETPVGAMSGQRAKMKQRPPDLLGCL